MQRPRAPAAASVSLRLEPGRVFLVLGGPPLLPSAAAVVSHLPHRHLFPRRAHSCSRWTGATLGIASRLANTPRSTSPAAACRLPPSLGQSGSSFAARRRATRRGRVGTEKAICAGCVSHRSHGKNITPRRRRDAAIVNGRYEACVYYYPSDDESMSSLAQVGGVEDVGARPPPRSYVSDRVRTSWPEDMGGLSCGGSGLVN